MGEIFVEAGFGYLCLEAAYPSSIIVSALIGAAFFARINKIRFFYAWLFLGVIASLFLAVPAGSSLLAMITVNIIFGASLGLGMPLCLSYFAESIPIENRGRVGGIILFATIFSAPVVSRALSMAMIDFGSSTMFLAIWRAWSLPLLFLISGKNPMSKLRLKKVPSIFSVLQNRTFSLYFVAWLMFALVDSFESAVVNPQGELQIFVGIIEPAVAGVSALVGGIVSDWVGRKKVLIFGFVSLGIAYATFAFLPQTWISWFLFFVIDGIALGLLWVVFTMVLWGEVDVHSAERYYSVGEAPFFLTQILSLLFAPYVASIPEVSAFSLAAFFLFIAVIPMLYARETLPEKKIQQRLLKIYTKEAIKLKHKVEE